MFCSHFKKALVCPKQVCNKNSSRPYGARNILLIHLCFFIEFTRFFLKGILTTFSLNLMCIFLFFYISIVFILVQKYELIVNYKQ